MNASTLLHALLWSAGIHYAILLVWFAAIVLARRRIRTLHRRWFALSDQAFDAIHYAAMAAYKVGILLFCVVPALALWLATRSG